MSNYWNNMPSVRHMVIFEAAARLGSFTQAAEELHMQQPSVSAAIKQIESQIGITLFYRSHRKVKLTLAGERLFAGVGAGLSAMENAFQSVQAMVSQDHVTLSTSSAFSHYWMMPRLQQLHDAFPDIDLRVQNSDREPDLDAENISLGIRLGYGNWQGYDSAKIADEVIYPVASPLVMHAAKNLRSLPTLMAQRLIHLEEPIRERPTWKEWFQHHKIPDAELTGGLRLNDYALVLQAAISGEGFAIGWHHIVSGMLQSGVLAAKQDWQWQTGRGVYLVWSQSRPLSTKAVQVRDWMIAIAR